MVERSPAWLYTFGAVFSAVTLVGIIAVPLVIDQAQRLYFRLQADVNQRQAAAMTRFVSGRLADGVGRDQVVREFQAAIEGSQVDRGYVCLIDRRDSSYVSHPDTRVLGMAVKPMAHFDPTFSSRFAAPWAALLSTGAEQSGLLSLAPGMASEVVSFMSVPGTSWTVSSHENTNRIAAELTSLRFWLSAWAIVLGLAIAIPASIAARRVSNRFERDIQERARLSRQLLEAEDARKTRELEAARAIQVSMLPGEVPQHSTVRLGAFLQTATEVGGDYYDFDVDGDVLTVAVGDVTGHGLRAGMMTTVVKSLFTHSSRDPDLLGLMRRASATLTRMSLPSLAVALGLVRVRRHEVEIAGAGLPPALHYRAGTGGVERIRLDGLPLGVDLPLEVPYSHTAFTVAPGDVIVLMSDGLPELFDRRGEMFGAEGAERVLKGHAAGPPDALVLALAQAGLDWSGGGALDDDVTIVALAF